MFSSPEDLKINDLNAIKCTEKTDKMYIADDNKVKK